MKTQRYRNLFNTIREISTMKQGRADCKILEVGVYDGTHALQMVSCVYGSCMSPIYYGLDLFDKLDEETKESEHSKPKTPPSAERIRKRILSKYPEAQVCLIEGNTRETFPDVVGDLPEMDMIFLDGGHSEETFKSDWACCQKLIGESTIVLIDDFYRNQPESTPTFLIQEIIDSGKYRTSLLSPVDRVDTREICMIRVEQK